MSRVRLQYVHCNTAGAWICEKYAHALQSSGAEVELVGLRFDGGRNVIRGVCDNLVPQRTFGFPCQLRSRVRLLKCLERVPLDLRKLIEHRKFFRYIRQSQATHYVAADPLALAVCVKAKQSAGAKVFYLPFEHYRDHIGVDERRKRQFIRLESEHLPQVTAAIFCGDTLLQDYVAVYDCAPYSHVVYNGWPLSLTAKRRALRQATGVAADQIVLLYQGGIQVDRGLTDVVAAMAALPKHICFVILGYGSDGEQVRACALANGVSKRVIQLPPVPQAELIDYSADADIGIIPLRNVRSHRYACPGKLFEFIGAGLPLVVSDMPDLRRFVTTYGLGETFKSGDVADLMRAVGVLVESADRRQQCARNSRMLHETTVCWEVQSRNLCDIILR